MHNKIMFKISPISYSQFLRSKKENISSKQNFINADFFKRSISFHYQHLYASKKWQNWIYRLIFFGLGLLFLVLGTLIFFKTVNFAYGFYFQNNIFIKNGINAFCFFLSAIAWLIGHKIHPEKEAIQHIMSKVERELNPAKHLQIEFNAIIANLTEFPTNNLNKNSNKI